MNADDFNRLHEVGTPVFAYPGCRPEDDRNATRLVTRTRSKASVLGGHTDVVWVDGHSACIALTHVDVVSEEQFAEARAAETAAAVAVLGALPMPVGDQPLDDRQLADALAAYEGHPDLGFACCTAHAVADHVPALLAELAVVRTERDRYRSAWQSASFRAEARGEGILRITRDRESYQGWLEQEQAATQQLRARVAELEAEREKLVRWHGEDSKTITRLVARMDRHRARLVALQNDALSMRGSLAPADGDRKVPFELGETLTPAVDWLIARVAELETLTPAPIQTCRVCGAGYSYGQPCSTCEFNARIAAETGGAS